LVSIGGFSVGLLALGGFGLALIAAFQKMLEAQRKASRPGGD